MSTGSNSNLNVVVPLHGDGEGRGEGDVVLGHRLDVDLLQKACVAHHLNIDQETFSQN